jgi:GNAT superfamily N-acetyltransferase
VIVEQLATGEIGHLLDVFNESRLHADGLSSVAVSVVDFQAQLEGECTFVAKLDCRAVGFVSVWSDNNFVHHLYVLPDFQNQGVGSALLKKCLDRFGLPLRLKCGKSNRAARNYYENAGWLRESEKIGPDGPYINYRLGDA